MEDIDGKRRGNSRSASLTDWNCWEKQNAIGLLVEWNKTEAEFPHHSCVQQLFEAQVARAPGRTALRVGATALSYAELDTRANRLAQALRRAGWAVANASACASSGALTCSPPC